MWNKPVMTLAVPSDDSINRVPHGSWLVAQFTQLWDGFRDLMQERCLPSFVEVLVLSGLGMFCGFVFVAYALQALVVGCVMAVGTTWGMVLGLLVDRMYQSQL